MQVEFDITDDDPSYDGRGTLPEDTVVFDDGNIVLRFGEVAIRMTYGQFDQIIENSIKWRNDIPANDAKI